MKDYSKLSNSQRDILFDIWYGRFELTEDNVADYYYLLNRDYINKIELDILFSRTWNMEEE